MAAVKDPETGLEFYELSHPWGMYTPIFPGYEEIKLERLTYHAKHGVMTHKITTIFHTSTHVNAPIHLLPETAGGRRPRARPLLRHRRRAVDPEGANGSWSSRQDLEKAEPADPGRRHRAHQHRLAPPLFRQQGIFRPRAGPVARRPPSGW